MGEAIINRWYLGFVYLRILFPRINIPYSVVYRSRVFHHHQKVIKSHLKDPKVTQKSPKSHQKSPKSRPKVAQKSPKSHPGAQWTPKKVILTIFEQFFDQNFSTQKSLFGPLLSHEISLSSFFPARYRFTEEGPKKISNGEVPLLRGTLGGRMDAKKVFFDHF